MDTEQHPPLDLHEVLRRSSAPPFMEGIVAEFGRLSLREQLLAACRVRQALRDFQKEAARR